MTGRSQLLLLLAVTLLVGTTCRSLSEQLDADLPALFTEARRSVE